jgi:hypothetical protein
VVVVVVMVVVMVMYDSGTRFTFVKTFLLL